MSNRLEQLTKLHQADPADTFLSYGIALEHGKAGRFDDAISWLDKTLELDPNYCYAFFQKARMYIEKGDDQTARQVLNTGLETARQTGDDHAHSEIQELLASLE